MCPAVDLNGAWSADDGATYFIRQLGDSFVTWAGLQESGFHRGVGFTNVFQGEISADGTTLTGEWADEPRGETLSSGTLSLQIVSSGNPDVLVPLQLNKNAAGTTGGFGATTWTPGAASLAPQDIEEVDGRVRRYDDDGPLGDNNPPCRDFTVMWGTVDKVTRSALPPDPNDYCSFAGDWGGDGDVNFDLSPDFSQIEPEFWTTRAPRTATTSSRFGVGRTPLVVRVPNPWPPSMTRERELRFGAISRSTVRSPATPWTCGAIIRSLAPSLVSTNPDDVVGRVGRPRLEAGSPGAADPQQPGVRPRGSGEHQEHPRLCPPSNRVRLA